jgi:hypothetical protein
MKVLIVTAAIVGIAVTGIAGFIYLTFCGGPHGLLWSCPF